jgi:hypothetical protein
MSSGKVKCTCGWSWNKSDSSKKDMYICHECGRDNSNNMKNGGWLDNYNDSEVSLPEGYVGEGYNTKGRDYSPAWGGQFQMGGSIPGAVGFTYARTNDPAPSNGPYAKKTKASAQKGKTIPKLDISQLDLTIPKSTGYAWADNIVKKNKKGLEKVKELKTKVDDRGIAAIKKQYKVDDAIVKI